MDVELAIGVSMDGSSNRGAADIPPDGGRVVALLS
jgi:hypothetical protein